MNQTIDKNIVQRKFKGISICSGKVNGIVCLYSAEHHRAVPEYSLLTDGSVELELNRFKEVLLQCSNELDEIAMKVRKSVGVAESEIFLTQKHIMNDPKVVDSIITMVHDERKNVEGAISDVLSSYEEQFASLDNQYLRERSSDIGEIRRRLLSSFGNKKNGFICEGQHKCMRREKRVVVTEELTADMIMSLNIDKVVGFVTEHGGITSHAAILARSLGIPSISGIHGVMDVIHCGDEVLLDGDSGELYINPEIELMERLIPVEQVQTGAMCILGTPEGMEVLSNASTIDDVKLAVSVGADGIGLFRTEILFIREERLLGEEEQAAYYSQVVSIMNNKPVTFRILDIGGDKPLRFLSARKEANPYLGWRGARFLLGNPEIFQTQVKAIARLSINRKIKILFPMVIDAHQYVELRTQALQAIHSLPDHNLDNVEFGAMFEVPSAFLQAEELLKLVDFGSIGSNDLIQYLFAIDRSNELVSQDYNPEHPVLWKMLSLLSETASRMGKPLSICGEIAGREGIPTRLLDIGIKAISVSPRLVPRVRNEMARYAGVLV